MKKVFLVLTAVVFTVSNAFAADALQTIMSRKSVRSYESAKVEQKDIDTILKAAMAAPSAMNVQPWAFVVINDRAALDELAAGLPYAKMLKEASVAIIVCGKEDKESFWVMDCSAASENILLAVEALGLGAVWTAVYPNKERIDAVRKIISIPNEYMTLNVIPIGKPKGQPQPKNKYDANKVHFNKW
jgi:nitroreductase